MERREAPGVCEAPYGSPLRSGNPARRGHAGVAKAGLSGCQDGVANPVPRRARPATASLRGSLPGRCASRRSTGRRQVSLLPAPGAACLISGPASRPVPPAMPRARHRRVGGLWEQKQNKEYMSRDRMKFFEGRRDNFVARIERSEMREQSSGRHRPRISLRSIRATLLVSTFARRSSFACLTLAMDRLSWRAYQSSDPSSQRF